MEDIVFNVPVGNMNLSDAKAVFAMNLGCAAIQVEKKPKSAAQKREKRIRKRKAATVLSQITSTENVSSNPIGSRSVLTVQAEGNPALAEGEKSNSTLVQMELEFENLEAESEFYSAFRDVFKRFECVAQEIPREGAPKSEIYLSDEEEDFTPEETPTPTLSQKTLRKLNRPSVGHLKQL